MGKRNEKASLVKRENQKVVAASDDQGNFVSTEAEVGIPQRYQYVDEHGEIHTGLRVIKDVDYSQPGEWWWKIMLSDLLDLLEDISGKQTQALRAILSQFDPHSGIVIVSQKELAKQAGCSLSTVSKVIHLMIKHDLIQMPQKGVYTINPVFMSQGGRNRFDALLIQYRNSGKHGSDEIIDIDPPIQNEKKLNSSNRKSDANDDSQQRG